MTLEEINVLSQDVLDVLAKSNVSTYIDSGEECNWQVEISFTTPRGGDENEIVEFTAFPEDDHKDNDSEFCYGLEKLFNEFDIDEYVSKWLDAKKTNKDVCPLGAVELVEEAKWIEDFLYKLYKQVEKILNKD